MTDTIADWVVKVCELKEGEDPKPLGTGFFVHPDGYILTCFHVIEKSVNSNLCVIGKDKTYCAEIIKPFPEKDIAVLKSDSPTDSWSPLNKDWVLGEEVCMYGFQNIEDWDGYPLLGEIEGTANKEEREGVRVFIKIRQIDIKSGMSGAPVYSLTNKKVVGMISLAYPKEGTGFAISASDVLESWEWLESEYQRITTDEHEAFRETVAYCFRLTNHIVEMDVPIGIEYKADMVLTFKEPALGTFTKALVRCVCISEDKIDDSVIRDTALIGGIAKKEIDINQVVMVADKDFSVETKRRAEEHGIYCRTLKQIENDLINFDRYIDSLIRNYESDELSKYYVDLKTQKGLSRSGEPTFLKNIINDNWSGRGDRENAFIILLGEYGTGKTSFCRKIACDFAHKYKDNPGRYRIPILFNLKPYSKALNIDQVTTTTLVKDCNANLSDGESFEQMNKWGSFVLLYDGFNEMALRLTPAEAVENFKQLATTFSENTKVIITCRTEYLETFLQVNDMMTKNKLGPSGLSPRFEILHLRELDSETIKEYLKKRDIDNWEEYWNVIRNSEYLFDLARRPFFLEMISQIMPHIEEEIKQGREDNSINMGELMTHYAKEVFSKWGANGVDPGNLINEEKFLLLSEISYRMIENDKMTIEYSDIRAIVEEHLPALNKILNSQFGNNVVKRIEEEIDNYCRDLLSKSILKGWFGKDQREIGHHMSEFSHSCFMYFFAANKFFNAILKNDPCVFDISFVGAETILLVKDFILLDNDVEVYRNKISQWLEIKNYNIQKYAILFLAFIGINQTADLIRKKVEEMYGTLKLPDQLKRDYDTERDHIDHLKLHAVLTLSQLGSRDYRSELIRVLMNDPDYTHRWYALLGVDEICSRDASYYFEFRDALRRIIDDKDEKPELQRLSLKILDANDDRHYNVKTREQRRYERYSVVEAVRISSGGETQDVTLIDISEGGALVQTGAMKLTEDKPTQLAINDNMELGTEIVEFRKNHMHLKFPADNQWDQIKAHYKLEEKKSERRDVHS